MRGTLWRRGNNRIAMFQAPSDYRIFLTVLGAAAREHAVAIHAYTLMTNRVHLIVTPATAASLPALMQAVGRSYVPSLTRATTAPVRCGRAATAR